MISAPALPASAGRLTGRPLTTGNIISIRSQTHKVLLVDVTLEGTQTVRFADVPQLELTVRRPDNQEETLHER